MQNFLFLAIALFAFQMVSAQESTNVQDETIYYTADLEVRPEFYGGMAIFIKFIGTNYQVPDVKNLNGKVLVTFVVEKDGSLTNFKVRKDLGYGTGDEAIRVLKLSPKWKPGVLNGKNVRCAYSLPINVMGKL
ncbi:energy transducer TonB [Flavobacterium nackdongense]|uniref:TonB C-terminal domain-containing protein n=1 Tax=Flavobacterium nackdongense TaxID=2547394 RepID=A0A4P6YCU0_9FLAO|nr:energy transducer TonB [Flavobacterium nackdongense]QBN18684.1 hypothetical protein E1750_07655 [Flavobacterium nackdongense]